MCGESAMPPLESGGGVALGKADAEPGYGHLDDR